MSSGPDIGSPFPGGSESGKRGPIPPPQSQPGLNGPRIPPDFRNGDFLSRLLAATPPYLYNIPLVPQSFFFSDMLKSFVQSNNNNNNNNNSKANEPPQHHQSLRENSGQMEFHSTEMQKDLPGRPPHRRRKRTWREVSDPPRFAIDRKPPPILDKPLELTTNNKHSSSEEKIARHEGPLTPALSSPPLDQTRTSPSSTTSPPILPPPPPPLMLPNLPPCGMLPLDFNRMPPTSTDGPSLPNELMPSHLPPFPPPLWYPSMYPGLGGPSPHHQTPYGIDPLHFFIDLRVSGHIWDRKLPPFGTVPSSMSPPQAGLDCTIDRERRNSTPVVTELENDADTKSGVLNLSSSSNNKPGLNLLLGMKNSKHSSAFSVPEPKPLMMTTSKGHSRRTSVSSPNTNYVLQNLKRIYKSVKIEDGEEKDAVQTEVKDEEPEEGPKSPKKESTEGEGEKKERCKDLPALIGLELVVDYVKHEVKPGEKRSSPPSTPPTGDAAPKILAVTPEPEQAASP